MEFITLWTFSQSWALKNLPNLYWTNVEVAAKHSVMEVFLCGYHTSPLVWGFYDYARTKNPRKSSYQWINPKNVTSIYKSTSQGIMLRNWCVWNVFLRRLLYRSEDSIRATSAKCRMKRGVVHQMSSDILGYMNRHRSRYSWENGWFRCTDNRRFSLSQMSRAKFT